MLDEWEKKQQNILNREGGGTSWKYFWSQYAFEIWTPKK